MFCAAYYWQVKYKDQIDEFKEENKDENTSTEEIKPEHIIIEETDQNEFSF